MNILGIDTTRKNAIVFLLDTKDVSKNVIIQVSEDVKHSEGLFLYIEKAIAVTNLKLADIDAFACVVGPGSFTGIRVGMSTIKGLNAVAKKQVLSFNMFEILKSSHKEAVILLNSTNTSCYYAEVNNGDVAQTGVVDKDNIDNFASGRTVILLKDEQDLICSEYKNIKAVDNIPELIIQCVVEKLNCGNYGEFVPYYLQLSQAERNLK